MPLIHQTLASFAANGQNGSRRRLLTTVEQLTKVIADLGGRPVEEGTDDSGYEDVAGFLDVAALPENTGASADAGAAPLITDRNLLAAAFGIHSVEAGLAAFLNGRIGESPFPLPNDEPMSPSKVLAAAAGVIVSWPPAPAGAGEAQPPRQVRSPDASDTQPGRLLYLVAVEPFPAPARGSGARGEGRSAGSATIHPDSG